ncbi:MAG: pyridoxamine 5'-phosphate oxidase family protein [Halobacteriota archaeon]
MDFEECVKFANEHSLCLVATVDGDQPHVRRLVTSFGDKNGFYFSTGKMKDVF